MTPHLTHEQLCDLLLARSPHPLSSDYAALQEHLIACPDCSTELSSLSASLLLLRDASTSYARQQFTPLSAGKLSALPRPRSLVHPIYWAVAAAILAVAVIPASLHREHQPLRQSASVIAPIHTQQSDEALLEEISQELSEPIPTPMRPLADPTASSAPNQSTASQRNN